MGWSAEAVDELTGSEPYINTISACAVQTVESLVNFQVSPCIVSRDFMEMGV